MVVTQSILSFLLSIIISLGGSVTADNVGQDFSSIYNNQNPFIQQKIDQCALAVDPTGQLITNLKTEGIKLTTEILYDIQDGKVTNQVIQNTIGSAEWGNFIASNINDVKFDESKYSWFDSETGYYIKPVFTFTNREISRNLVLFDANGNELQSLTGLGFITDTSKLSEDEYNTYYNAQFENFEYDKTTGKYSVDVCFINYGVSVRRHDKGTCDYLKDNTFDKVADASMIGTAVGAAGSEFDISSDGTITLPDGSRVFPNADGTYTIGGTTYSPVYNLAAYDDSALLGLLNQLLQRIDDLENKLEFEKEIDTPVDYDKAFENVQAYQGTMSEFIYSSPKWTTVFPFCIPWDFVRGVKLLSAAPVAPRFDIPFEIPAFGAFKGYATTISLDFSEYEKYFQPVRWFTTTFFLIGLGFVTFKIVKGAA